MAENNWVTTLPIDHTQIGNLPGSIRDLKSSAKIIIAKEHETPGTSQAGGQHLKGAARVYLASGQPTTDPEGNNLDTTSTTDDGRVCVLTGSSNIMRVYIATAAGVSTGFEGITVERVKLIATGDCGGYNLKNIASGTQSGQAIHVGQIDTTALTGQLRIVEPATGAMISVKVPDPPSSDNHIVGYKYFAANVPLSAWTTEDADTAAMAAGTTYTATSDGLVNVYATKAAVTDLKITIVHGGITNVIRHTPGSATDCHCSGEFSVKSGDTFVVTDNTGGSTVAINWRSFGTLSKPTK